MIIELNGNREGKPLCHVTMHGSKISGSQHNCVPANMAGIKKNWHVWLSFAWLHCHTGIKQNGNKTGQRNNTATKKWPDKPLWGTCAYRAVAVPEKGGRPPSFGRKPRPTWLRQTDTSLWQSFLNTPPPPFPPYLKVWIRHCSYTIEKNDVMHITMVALFLDDNRTKDDGDGRRTAKK